MKAKKLLELHDEMTARCKAIMTQKNSDYTGGENATDALANFKGAATLGIHPVMGLLLRVQDKMKRIESFVADGKLRVTGETVQDACDDMLNYSILAAALLKEEAEKLNDTVLIYDPTAGEPEYEARPVVASRSKGGYRKLPVDFIEYGCRPLHHAPTAPTNDVMYRQTLRDDWRPFDSDAPVHAFFALKSGSCWASLNGVFESETRNSEEH